MESNTEALLEAFLRHFDRAVLVRLLDHQRALPPSASAAARGARMAGGIDRFAQKMSDAGGESAPSGRGSRPWKASRRPNFAAALAEALRDAAGALLREIDFVREAANLRDARAFYKFNRRIRVPATIGLPLDRGIFMEFLEGVPLLDAPLDYESRRDAARLVFRRLVLDPLFSGPTESIFHADPHAGNLMTQTQKHAPLTLVLPPGCSQAKPSCEPEAFNSRGSTGPISIIPGCPRERSRLISRARSENGLCSCKNLVDAFRKSVRSSIQKLGNHPEPSLRKEVRKEHEC